MITGEESCGISLKSYLDRGKISSLLYSNPNNPSWICFNEEELAIIGELAKKYDVVVLEDLAYFGMDFRKDISVPGIPPFQPTVAKYTDNYILLVSTSKVFSYAGQRIAMMAVSDHLFNRKYPDLMRYFTSEVLGHTIIYGALYALSAGASHSAQLAVAAMLKAANDGHYNLLKDIRQYGERARVMKKMFISTMDSGLCMTWIWMCRWPMVFILPFPIPGLPEQNCWKNLLHYGISAITLDITGSTRTEGLRACVSQISPELFPVLEERLNTFQKGSFLILLFYN